MLSKHQKKSLLKLARRVIEAELKEETIGFSQPEDEIFNEKMGGFVTLHSHGKLRGCIGYVEGFKSIYHTIIDMAKSAAFHDPRFSPISLKEMDEIEIEISLLSPLEKFKDINEIEIGKHGLLFKSGMASGLLLPQVAVEWGWNVEEFAEQTCRKAGMNLNCWQRSDCDKYRFEAVIFSEKMFDT